MSIVGCHRCRSFLVSFGIIYIAISLSSGAVDCCLQCCSVSIIANVVIVIVVVETVVGILGYVTRRRCPSR